MSAQCHEERKKKIAKKEIRTQRPYLRGISNRTTAQRLMHSILICVQCVPCSFLAIWPAKEFGGKGEKNLFFFCFLFFISFRCSPQLNTSKTIPLATHAAKRKQPPQSTRHTRTVEQLACCCASTLHCDRSLSGVCVN